MVVAMVTVFLRLPAAGSLKDKRGVTRRLIARLRRELNVSVAEVGGLDSWQRCVLGVAVPAGRGTGRPDAGAPKKTNVNGVASFFQEAPLQFDPGAIRAAGRPIPSTGSSASPSTRHATMCRR